MKTYRAREIIKKAYGTSKNMMTPHVLKYGKINKDMAYELSYGRGFSRARMYGVSVAKMVKGGKAIRSYEDSESFSSKAKAMNHIDYLKSKYN